MSRNSLPSFSSLDEGEAPSSGGNFDLLQAPPQPSPQATALIDEEEQISRLEEWYRNDPKRARYAIAVGAVVVLTLIMLLVLLLKPPPRCEHSRRQKKIDSNFDVPSDSFTISCDVNLKPVALSGIQSLVLASKDKNLTEASTIVDAIHLRLENGRLVFQRWGGQAGTTDVVSFPSIALEANIDYVLSLSFLNSVVTCSVSTAGKATQSELATLRQKFDTLKASQVVLLNDLLSAAGTKFSFGLYHTVFRRKFRRCVN